MDLIDYLIPPWLQGTLGAIFFAAFGLFIVLLLAVALISTLTKPHRSRELSKLLLDLIVRAASLKGNPPQNLARLLERDTSAPLLSSPLHALSSDLEQSTSISQTFRKHKKLLPPPMVEMLAIGEKLGNISKVLPACREMLSDLMTAQLRAYDLMMLHYTLLLPATLSLTAILHTFVTPKLHLVMLDMEISNHVIRSHQSFLQNSIAWYEWLPAILISIWICVECLKPSNPLLPFRKYLTWLDRAELYLPWRRKRITRTFSRMLGVLLEAGIPEPEALSLAAASTVNQHLIFWSSMARLDLAQGSPLHSLIAEWDHDGELQWRIKNALPGKSKLGDTLNDWCSHLSSKALQQETNTKQCLAALFILSNGFVVGSLAVHLFSILTQTMEQISLW